MSIVEKAVGKESESRAAHKGVGPAIAADIDQSSGRSEHHTSEPDTPDNVVAVTNLSDHEFISVLEDEDLSKAFRFLKRAILAKLFDPTNSDVDAGRVLMVSSAMPGAGKSFLAFNLAASIAREKLIDVVLVDTDTVRHKLSTVLGLDDRQGLVEMLTSQDFNSGILNTDLPGLRFVPSGLDNDTATELLASEYMADVLSSLAAPNTVVVLDTTPLLVTSEADAVAAHVDHTVVVVESGETSADEIDIVKHMLEKSCSSVSFIMNKLKSVGNRGVTEHYRFPY